MEIHCSGCGDHLHYASASLASTVKHRNVVSYALRLASFASGIGFSGYNKLFSRFLGIATTSDKMFYRVIEEVFRHINAMLDDVCEMGKEEMKSLPDDQLGSWKRAVTTSDGCWHIRGFFFAEQHIYYPELAHRGLTLVWTCLHERL